MQIQALLTAATLNLKQLVRRLPVGQSGAAALAALASLKLRYMALSRLLSTGFSRFNAWLSRPAVT